MTNEQVTIADVHFGWERWDIIEMDVRRILCAYAEAVGKSSGGRQNAKEYPQDTKEHPQDTGPDGGEG